MCSAMFLSAKTNSATTEGFVRVSRHDKSPLTPFSSRISLCRADSISAAVVPGAKLLASTVKGPALPFMLRPLPFGLRDCEEMTLACGESSALASRDERAFGWDDAAEVGLEDELKELLRGEPVLATDDDRYRNTSAYRYLSRLRHGCSWIVDACLPL
jgi:hypothetical protein